MALLAMSEARLDVKARGLWGGTFECAFFNVRVFNPRARSNEARHSWSTASIFRRHEQHNRCQYDQRVRDVEMAFFTPLVFTASGGFKLAHQPGSRSSTSPRALQQSSRCHTLLYYIWAGCGAALASLSYAPPWCASVRMGRANMSGEMSVAPH